MIKDSSEDLKAAAAFSFGNITVGRYQTQLPVLLDIISKDELDIFFLLTSLKQVCFRAAAQIAYEPYLNQVTNILNRYMDHQDAILRGVIAECLGSLISHNPEGMIHELTEKASSQSSAVRYTVAVCLRNITFFENKTGAWKENIFKFFSILLDDSDIVSIYCK
jgi:HEAT repeat protein